MLFGRKTKCSLRETSRMSTSSCRGIRSRKDASRAAKPPPRTRTWGFAYMSKLLCEGCRSSLRGGSRRVIGETATDGCGFARTLPAARTERPTAPRRAPSQRGTSARLLDLEREPLAGREVAGHEAHELVAAGLQLRHDGLAGAGVELLALGQERRLVEHAALGLGGGGHDRQAVGRGTGVLDRDVHVPGLQRRLVGLDPHLPERGV